MTPQLWRDHARRSAAGQMAIDHAMLDESQHSGATLVRIYRWERDTVSFGANESAQRSWNRAEFEARHLPVVRRPTGGRAVWHAAADLTYAVAAPQAAFGGLKPAYQRLHALLADALARFDLAVALAATPGQLPGLAPGACFSSAAGGEVLVAGRKTIGSAQLASGAHFLQHGAIALADRTALLAPLALAGTAPPAITADVPLPDADRVEEAIAEAWQAAGATMASHQLASAVIARAAALEARYADPEWTWRR